MIGGHVGKGVVRIEGSEMTNDVFCHFMARIAPRSRARHHQMIPELSERERKPKPTLPGGPLRHSLIP
jgi:hypothetical protein